MGDEGRWKEKKGKENKENAIMKLNENERNEAKTKMKKNENERDDMRMKTKQVKKMDVVKEKKTMY